MAGATEQGLSRRDFLERAAFTAGLAGLGSVLPADTILAEAAGAQARRSGLPRPRNVPIDHFVILMMENRSFDHYFGWVPDADGMQHQTYARPDGTRVGTFHAADLGRAQWQGCGHPDPGHGWDQGRTQLRDGFLAEGSGNDEFALCYYDDGDLGFIQAAARQFTLFDRYHCSLLASTWPNRYYKWSAQSGGRVNNDPPVDTLGNQWETIFDRALSKGVSARYYNSDLPFSVVWGPRAVPWTNPIERYYLDCAAGTLPQISIVDPPFRDGGGFDGNSADEHPLGDVRLGQALMADVVHAFMKSPNWRRGALFIIYDEWGGFFDHVRPPSVPDDRSSSSLDQDFGQMGFRTPAVAISPYARNRRAGRGRFRVNHGLYGHESILKLIEYRFGLGSLVKRDARARNIGLAFDFHRPDFEVPDLPDPSWVASRPCTLGGGDVLDTAQAHANDLAELEVMADRLGFPVGDGAPHQLFTKPDSVRKALLGAGGLP
jgi:phospholipase C